MTANRITVHPLYADAYAVIGDPVTVTVTPASGPDISASAATVAQDQNVTISYSAPPGQLRSANQIVWYSPDRPVGISAANTSQDAPGASGMVTFSTSGLTAGVTYTAYLLSSDGSTPIGAPITVTPAPGTAGTLAAALPSTVSVMHSSLVSIV